MSWQLVAFYTENNAYKGVAEEHLLASVYRLSRPLNINIEIVPDRFSWISNIAHKPEVIERALYRYKNGVDVLYTDVDSEVMSYPELIDNIPAEYDIAFHTLDHNKWYGKSDNRKEIFNGTVFFRNNEKVRRFVTNWKIKCQEGKRIWEPHWFEESIRESDLKVYDLPLSYAYIYSLPDGSKPNVVVENPVIVHYQASRKHRKR